VIQKKRKREQTVMREDRRTRRMRDRRASRSANDQFLSPESTVWFL
jgi:hypothetical protein